MNEVERIIEELHELGDVTCIADGVKHSKLYRKLTRAMTRSANNL